MAKEIVAMLLAGGQGTRLYDLTDTNAKPAVSFGGHYKIIDFTLSNCLHSQINTVGILTQYEPFELTRHVGNGAAWELDIQNGGLSILSPYQNSAQQYFYKGTAHAIYANMHFLDYYHPKHVLILSGDQIYKMDYMKMLKEHEQRDADLTIAVMDVSLEEASRFGVMITNEEGQIIDFEEKPKQPKSTLASMGIYIFKYSALKQYLKSELEKETTNYDFGKDIIPAMVYDHKLVYAHVFDGYWKDVGTIDSLWQANMDLIEPGEKHLDLKENLWKIFSKSVNARPAYIGDEASIVNSLIDEGASVEGDVEKSIISLNVTIEEGARVSHSVVLPGAVIEEDAVIEYAIVDEQVTVPHGTIIKGTPDDIQLVSKKSLGRKSS